MHFGLILTIIQSESSRSNLFKQLNFGKKRALDSPPPHLGISIETHQGTNDFYKYIRKEANTGVPFMTWPQSERV
jgi:hypothetical protein